MQKVFNALSAISFIGFVTIAGGIGYVYIQKDAIIETAKERALEELSGALPGLLGGSLGGGLNGGLPSTGGNTAGSIGGSLPGASIPGLGL